MALVVLYQEVVLLMFENESKVFTGYTITLGVVEIGLVGFTGVTGMVELDKLLSDLLHEKSKNITITKNRFFILKSFVMESYLSNFKLFEL
jgi:hypothetical protein